MARDLPAFVSVVFEACVSVSRTASLHAFFHRQPCPYGGCTARSPQLQALCLQVSEWAQALEYGRSLVALDLQAVHGLRWDQSALVRGNPARHSRRCCQVHPSYQAVFLAVHRQRAVHLQDFQATTSRNTVLHYC